MLLWGAIMLVVNAFLITASRLRVVVSGLDIPSAHHCSSTRAGHRSIVLWRGFLVWSENGRGEGAGGREARQCEGDQGKREGERGAAERPRASRVGRGGCWNIVEVSAS